MRVRVLTFGVLRERLGGPEETVELEEGATVGELIEILRGRASNTSRSSAVDEGLWRSLAVAVNREYTSQAVVLCEGDEVALLPPVSGGCVSVSSGAKAPLYSCGFMARLKPCPSELGLGVRWVGASCVARCFAHGEKRASLASASAEG